MRAWLCTRLLGKLLQELVARGELQGGHHLTDGHEAVKDIQQALEFRGGTVAKKWRQTGRSQGAIRRRDKGRRGRTSRRRTVEHRGRAGKPLSTRRGAIKWRQTRRDINARQSQHKGGRRAPNGDKRDGAKSPARRETKDEGARQPAAQQTKTGAKRENR